MAQARGCVRVRAASGRCARRGTANAGGHPTVPQGPNIRPRLHAKMDEAYEKARRMLRDRSQPPQARSSPGSTIQQRSLTAEEPGWIAAYRPANLGSWRDLPKRQPSAGTASVPARWLGLLPVPDNFLRCCASFRRSSYRTPRVMTSPWRLRRGGCSGGAR